MIEFVFNLFRFLVHAVALPIQKVGRVRAIDRAIEAINLPVDNLLIVPVRLICHS